MLLDKKIPFRYIVGKIKVELFYILVIGVMVNTVTRLFVHVIPAIPIVIPTFLGTAISVVLSFKLSQSYDRWWEARKIWGSIVNDSRNLVLQLIAFVALGNQETIKRIALRQIAWCYSLAESLRGHDPLSASWQFMTDEEISRVAPHVNKPLALLRHHTEDLKTLHHQGSMGQYEHVQLNRTVTALTNWMGMAERIKSTVFPATYRLFLHLIIYVFIVTLSISLRDLESYIEIPLLMVVAAFFFLLERTATHLQDPFSDRPTDTAMSAIATNIEINIKQLLDLEQVPQPRQPDDFYLK
ncbi:bestrophin family protein [Pedobacter sp. GR22-6]|uniref:bestrophin family protein n=1 Tax=Pedobacter sp. GR22-6 TaxID=3127957 RepID=UPI00307EA4D2